MKVEQKSIKHNKEWGEDLLTIENAKTIKGESLGFLTGILYLAPAGESIEYGGKNMCVWASEGCKKGCLYSAGHGALYSVQVARISKTLHYLYNRELFMKDLEKSIEKMIKLGEKEDKKVCIRLNGTSDIGWDKLGVMEKYPEVIFYDYTKSYQRIIKNRVSNWYLTFSKSEKNEKECMELIENTDVNVAVVFDVKKGGKLPSHYMGREVINGDMHDLRFMDRRNVIVGLTAKGKAKKDKSGFVVKVGEKVKVKKVKVEEKVKVKKEVEREVIMV
jgi:hypothetical protein